MSTNYPLVMVIWDDATELSGWRDGHEELVPCLITSVGFLVKKERRYLIIAQDLAKDGKLNGCSQIPRGMVKKITTLRKPDGR